ncbi:MAG: hypothetical protein DRJ03_07290 [Chloroflexi bacterium]|nr:MAG: hypothetical protein DRJ03_07290 [Chloroflexota bacterium]
MSTWTIVWTVVKTLVALLVSLGVFKWLHNKARESKLVQKHHAQWIVDKVFDWVVQAAQTWGKNTGASGMEQREKAIENAKAMAPHLSNKEVETGVDAAYHRMKEDLKKMDASPKADT